MGGLILQIQLDKAIEILKKEFNPIVIYLFGSGAKNKLRDDSDIDIAFLTDSKFGHAALTKGSDPCVSLPGK